MITGISIRNLHTHLWDTPTLIISANPQSYQSFEDRTPAKVDSLPKNVPTLLVASILATQNVAMTRTHIYTQKFKFCPSGVISYAGC